MLIREMRITDYDSLVQFWLSVPGLRLVDADSREAIDRYLKRNPGLSFLAEEEGSIAGTVMAGHGWRRGYLFHYAVDEKQRGGSLAKELLKKAFAGLRREGISRCFGFILAENERAMRLAELTGWDRVTEFEVFSQWLAGENGQTALQE